MQLRKRNALSKQIEKLYGQHSTEENVFEQSMSLLKITLVQCDCDIFSTDTII